MEKKYKRIRHHLAKRKSLYYPASFVLFLLFFIGVFYSTRTDIPATYELSFTERSAVSRIVGSVVPASCDSNGNYNGDGNYSGCTLCSDGTYLTAAGQTCPPVSCPADAPYTETNPGAIDNYCGACAWGYAQTTSLSCDAAPGWAPYGPSCTAPSCSGCGCTLICSYSYTSTDLAYNPDGCSGTATYYDIWSCPATGAAYVNSSRTAPFNSCPAPTNGACGTTYNTCDAGTFVSGGYSNYTYSWSCNGTNGGTNASCSAYDSCAAFDASLYCPTDSCTTLDGTVRTGTKNCTATTPTNGLCSSTHYGCIAGTSAGNSFNGTTYSWSCDGTNGGSTDSCSETPTPVNGSCSATHYGCVSGTSGGTAYDGTTYTWSCTGSNGGSTASCSETPTVTCNDPAANNYGGALPCTYYTPMPDLTASAVSPSSALPGTPVTLSATITNQGDASTGGSFSNFIQVATAANGGGTITDLTSTTMSTLGSGASAVASQSYTFSSQQTYSARACADKTNRNNSGVISESNEGNNCGAWTNITVRNNPSIVGAAVNFPNISFTCYDSTSYSVIRNEGGYAVSGVTSSGQLVTVQFSQEGNYTLSCIYGGTSASTTVNYVIPPLTLDGMTINANPRTVNNNKNTVVSWTIINPKSTCSLSAQIVCVGGHASCSQSQLTNEAYINTQLQGSTDPDDPYGGNRNIQTAVQSPYTQYSNKAMGKKTLLMSNTMDFILDCRGSLIKKVRVVVSNENEG